MSDLRERDPGITVELIAGHPQLGFPEFTLSFMQAAGNIRMPAVNALDRLAAALPHMPIAEVEKLGEGAMTLCAAQIFSGEQFSGI